jgi:ribosomal protein S18 acetylase RimI-like enzyme
VNRDWERMLESMRVFFRGISESAEGAHFVEPVGVLAGVNPRVPERSLPNSVVYRDEDALEAALPELAASYDEAGVLAWTVWVPEHHQRTRRLLEEAGHRLDATPTAMIAPLEEIEPPRPDDPEPEAAPSNADVGRINDLAYGSGDAFQRMTGDGPADPAYTYVARLDGEPAAVVVSQDHEGDCSMWCVATLPDARGRGLVSGLMRRALADGRGRGCDVTTLQATKLGRPVYERLGYRSFGTIEMWERRRSRPRPAPPSRRT